ncbi:Creatinase/aminopeptidase [Meredithblackwellia eburnea MCA 4105]
MASCWSSIFNLRRYKTRDDEPLLEPSPTFEKANGVAGHVSQHSSVTADEPSTTERLLDLRRVLEDEKLDAYVIPTADAHGSEYVGECDKRRAWISGFTGSAGVAIVTKTDALLFTDSRYFVQAAKELDSNWTLMKVGLKDVPTWDEYLCTLPSGTRVGTDAQLTSSTFARYLVPKLKSSGISLLFPFKNLVDEIWLDRPPRSAAPVVSHPLKFAGQAAGEKIANLRSYLESSKLADGRTPSYLLTSLPNIAWILNLRGSDIAFSPLFFAYLLVAPSELILWIQDNTLTDEARQAFEEIGGQVREYGAVWQDIKGRTIFANQASSWALVQAIGESNFTAVIKSPIDVAQAIKNDVELAGFRAAYIRDGAAWVRWAAWLESEMKKGSQILEWDAAEELTRYRKENEFFAGLAYENISATGENAAENSSVINLTTPYLNDSGAQYLDGTIDTTRTVHFGKPTKEQKRAFTRVLQGHIAVDSLVFPEGTTGLQIDILARRPLWHDGLNYLHGTGHGVGEYLSVHEGPEGIGASLTFHSYPLVPGHVMSNEPAYYEAGSYGIRTESIIGVKEVTTRRGFGDKKWLGFERFTMIPIQSAMVDFALLSTEEKIWLRKHNKHCAEVLLPIVSSDKRAVKYLAKQ